MSDKLSRDLEEIWEFYEGDKLSIAEFLRGPHKEGYDDEQLERMKKEADEIEGKLDSKRDSIKRIKSLLTPVPEEKLEEKENSLIEHEKGWLPKDKEEWEKESEND